MPQLQIADFGPNPSNQGIRNFGEAFGNRYTQNVRQSQQSDVIGNILSRYGKDADPMDIVRDVLSDPNLDAEYGNNAIAKIQDAAVLKGNLESIMSDKKYKDAVIKQKEYENNFDYLKNTSGKDLENAVTTYHKIIEDPLSSPEDKQAARDNVLFAQKNFQEASEKIAPEPFKKKPNAGAPVVPKKAEAQATQPSKKTKRTPKEVDADLKKAVELNADQDDLVDIGSELYSGTELQRKIYEAKTGKVVPETAQEKAEKRVMQENLNIAKKNIADLAEPSNATSPQDILDYLSSSTNLSEEQALDFLEENLKFPNVSQDELDSFFDLGMIENNQNVAKALKYLVKEAKKLSIQRKKGKK